MRKAILPVLFTLICSFQSDAQLLPCNAHFIFQLSNTANGIYFSGPANPTGAVYNWQYGDGSSGTGMNSFHSYAPGNYLACLTVTIPAALNTLACTSTFCDSIHISPVTVNCNAAFTMQPGSATNSIQFINSSNPTGTIYSWSFGDNTTSTNADPAHTFAPGNYQVCLTVTVPSFTGTALCTSTHCDSVHIAATTNNCNAHFLFQFSNTANGIYFSGSANPTVAVYNWHMVTAVLELG